MNEFWSRYVFERGYLCDNVTDYAEKHIVLLI